MVETDGPSFALYITGPAFLISLVIVIHLMQAMTDAPTRFVLLAIWCRYTVAMFHEVTYRPVVGGLSIVAILTVAIVGYGISILGPRVLAYARIVPFYPFAAVALASSILNDRLMGLFNNGMKWLFMILLTIAAYEGMKRHGAVRLFRAVAFLFVVPIVLQWLSYVTDLKKVSESSTSADLAVSFIAGYQHQAGFAVIILTFLVVVIFAEADRFIVSLGGIAAAFTGLILCDYRTAMIAAALPAASFMLAETVRRFDPRERAQIITIMAALLAIAVAGLFVMKQDRFSDLLVIADKGGALVKPPEHFTEPEQKMLSGRAILWSDYISSYLRLDAGSQIIGRGADSWVGQFSLYAHNNFVSFLYEYGALGLALFVVFLASGIATAARSSGISRIGLLCCHVGFVLLSLGTMPMWLVEGGILYALLLARTWYANLEWTEARATAAVADEPGWLAERQPT